MMRVGVAVMVSALVLGLAATASAGTVTVGSGSTLDLGTGSMALGCADLTVTGTLTAGTIGFAGARDVMINPTGTLNGDSATLALAGNWDKAGTFNAGTSTVQMVDGCSLFSSVVSGNSSFSKLSIVTATAKQVSFTFGSTTSVSGLLTLVGSAGNLLKIRSTLGGSAAMLNAVGGSNVSFVDVQDTNALPGNDIPLPLNSVKGINTLGWVVGIAVPLLGPLGVGVLVLMLALSGRRWLSRSNAEV